MKIFLIEDEPLVVDMLKKELFAHDVFHLDSLADWNPKTLLSWGCPALALFDLKSSKDPDAQISIQKISEFKGKYPRCEIWIQSGSDDLSLMRSCSRAGAHKFVLKPHFMEELPLILEWAELRIERRDLLASNIIGQSSLIQSMREELLSLQEACLDVLIEGESGTGKELCAQSFALSTEPFVSINASALPAELFEGEIFGYEKGAFSGASSAKEGLLESAGKGVFFLDEVQSLPMELQPKLLRVLETRQFRRLGSTKEREFAGRIVCASNLVLREAVDRGEFREDLYYRLAPVTVNVPPLRLRKEDIPLLVESFLKNLDPSKQFSLNEEAMLFLYDYDWPGNIRELKGLLKALIAKTPYPILGKLEVESELSKRFKNLFALKSAGSQTEAFAVDWSVGLDANVRALEEWMMKKVLEEFDGTEARERLKLKRSRYYEKMKQYNLIT